VTHLPLEPLSLLRIPQLVQDTLLEILDDDLRPMRQREGVPRLTGVLETPPLAPGSWAGAGVFVVGHVQHLYSR